MTPRQRDIVLIPVPFTDLSSTKRRPVLVLSSTSWNAASQDVIVAAITSNLGSSASGIIINAADLDEGGLRQVSLVRADKIYTLSQTLIVRRYGRLSSNSLARVIDELDTLLELSP